jgi:hypothetical protein
MRHVVPAVAANRIFAGSAALLFALGCAHGQDLKAAQACAPLSDDAARLKCYDAAMGIAKPAPGAAVKSPAPTPDDSRNQAKFGDDGRLHTDPKPALPKSLTAQVRAVAPLADGLYRLTLDNGQVWDTTQADSALVFKINDGVIISRGLLGSYRISLAGHTTSVSASRKK